MRHRTGKREAEEAEAALDELLSSGGWAAWGGQEPAAMAAALSSGLLVKQ